MDRTIIKRKLFAQKLCTRGASPVVTKKHAVREKQAVSNRVVLRCVWLSMVATFVSSSIAFFFTGYGCLLLLSAILSMPVVCVGIVSEYFPTDDDD